MQVLITGSSGQIGTNLALRLLADGHRVFGVDKRPNQWTDDFRYVIQDLSAPYRDFNGGIGSVPYPHPDVVVHLAANAKVHELVEFPHRALENITLTYNVLEYCRAQKVPIIFSSSREVYGDIHRYLTEEAQADFTAATRYFNCADMVPVGADLRVANHALAWKLIASDAIGLDTRGHGIAP